MGACVSKKKKKWQKQNAFVRDPTLYAKMHEDPRSQETHLVPTAL